MNLKNITHQNQLGILLKRNIALKSVFAESILLLIGLNIGALIHYNSPRIVSVIIQGLTLFFFYRSKKNYPWIFILFFVSFIPGGIFRRELIIIQNPMLGVVTFEMLFVLVSWLKVFKKKVPIFYTRYWLMIIIYSSILLLLFGGRIMYFIRIVLFFSWLMILPKLLSDENEIDKLFFFIFMGNIFVFITSAYQIVTNQLFVNIFTESNILVISRYDDIEISRTAFGLPFSLLAVIGGLIYLSKDRSQINSVLSYISVFFGVLNIIFSATRGWIIAIVILLFSYSFFMFPKVLRNLAIILPALFISILLVWQIPIFRSQVTKTYYRTIHFQNLLELDFNPETTQLGRITGGARIMNKFWESPILGFGFSKDGRDYSNEHYGNQSLLLNYGFLGIILFIFLWGSYISRLFSIKEIKSIKRQEYRINVLLTLSFLCIFFIHRQTVYIRWESKPVII